jgi:hypothetical protein
MGLQGLQKDEIRKSADYLRAFTFSRDMQDLQLLIQLVELTISRLFAQFQPVAEEKFKKVAKKLLYSMLELVKLFLRHNPASASTGILLQLAVDKKIKEVRDTHVSAIFIYLSGYVRIYYEHLFFCHRQVPPFSENLL